MAVRLRTRFSQHKLRRAGAKGGVALIAASLRESSTRRSDGSIQRSANRWDRSHPPIAAGSKK